MAEIKSGKNSTPAAPSAVPKRFIFTAQDMEKFKVSDAKRDLLSFVTALGRSAISTSYAFDPEKPLEGLSPGLASLHGSLQAISSTWLKELPPDENARARFGNPVFKTWHARLTERSRSIIQSIMKCHVKYVVSDQKSQWDMSILKECADAGAQAALTEASTDVQRGGNEKEDQVIAELDSYLLHSFGHEVRLDFGTGHECSFYVFLYCLCKIGVFGNLPKTVAPSQDAMVPIALAITAQYLEVCRGIQTDYFLEPAGSHGVWGLDDYHCIPFYIGACQMQNHAYDDKEFSPSSIHNDQLLRSNEGSEMLYFQCIRYIKSLKKGVPFFESSPMLDDISNLKNWAKVSGGLIKLFDGEVLNRKPVVQHFVFGEIFKATWEPSRSEREAPSSVFNEPAHLSVDSVAPWALKHKTGEQQGIPSTKAPWAP